MVESVIKNKPVSCLYTEISFYVVPLGGPAGLWVALDSCLQFLSVFSFIGLWDRSSGVASVT